MAFSFIHQLSFNSSISIVVDPSKGVLRLFVRFFSSNFRFVFLLATQQTTTHPFLTTNHQARELFLLLLFIIENKNLTKVQIVRKRKSKKTQRNVRSLSLKRVISQHLLYLSVHIYVCMCVCFVINHVAFCKIGIRKSMKTKL